MEPVCTAAPCIRNGEGTASPIQSPLPGPANLIHFPLAISLLLSTSNAEPDLIPRYYGDSNRRSTGKLRMHDINVDSHSVGADSDSDCDCDSDGGRIRFRSNGHITFVHLQSSKWHYQFSLQELQVDPYTSTHTHIQTNICICVCACVVRGAATRRRNVGFSGWQQ